MSGCLRKKNQGNIYNYLTKICLGISVRRNHMDDNKVSWVSSLYDGSQQYIDFISKNQLTQFAVFVHQSK